ncbi:hypothetical protein C3B78_19055 [Arthrobacter sp. PGP41]|uniref:hypothetical protein n=1 Tax=unclassified Arthrobacter TaxID=235627 RepID=UPI000CDBB83D|nr:MULTISPECIES: hypothetical protein [unclassified Arthrobacter]AUZ36331.1 hypothetical protein C3B78_19055 [Arthrobacter sp. PGP41]MDT0196426.1 hypothetical protein [Arthrobacter sp. AB6]
MSVLVTFTELLPLESLACSASFNASPPQDGAVSSPAVHCGSAMELVTPAVGPAAVGYTFEPENGGPVHLPPVWRCGCGFQLDAWIESPYGHGSEDGAVMPVPARPAALSA